CRRRGMDGFRRTICPFSPKWAWPIRNVRLMEAVMFSRPMCLVEYGHVAGQIGDCRMASAGTTSVRGPDRPRLRGSRNDGSSSPAGKCAASERHTIYVERLRPRIDLPRSDFSRLTSGAERLRGRPG